MKLSYKFSEEQLDMLHQWQAEQDALWVQSQQMVDPNEPSRPYYGAIGGELSYTFTPTGIGMVVKVTHANGAEIDLTDYDAW